MLFHVLLRQTSRGMVLISSLSALIMKKNVCCRKIPGGFNRREGKPSDHAILTSRVIDRPMRPLFPKDLRNDVSIVSTVVSVDQDNSPEFCAMIGSSIAVSVSDIPFNGPVAAVYVGMIDGEFIINPTVEQREASDLNLVVSGSAKKVVMIEAGANEVS